MANDVRIIVLTRSEQAGSELRSVLAAVGGVKILAELEEPALLAQSVQQLPADVLLVNLDPAPESVLPILGEILQTHPDLAVFATSESTDGQLILGAMRLGIKEFLPKPIDQTALAEALQRVVKNRSKSTKSGTLITVFGAAGGVGSSFISTNLAVELAALAAGQVTIVDLDHRFGQVATLLDVDPRHTTADLCSSPEQLEPQVLMRALITHSSGVRVLSRPLDISEADTLNASSTVGVFAALIQLNEYVVSDGPTRFDAGGRAVLTLADHALLVVEPLVPCIRNAQRLLEHMREFGMNLDRVKLICNRAGSATTRLSNSDIKSALGMDVFASLPDEWQTASGAINLGEPLMSISPKTKLRFALQELATRLHTPDGESDGKDRHKQTLIERIFAGGG